MLMIDRFEGDSAVVETSTGLIEIPRNELPPEAKEGDVLKLIIDSDGTASRKHKIKRLMEQVFED